MAQKDCPPDVGWTAEGHKSRNASNKYNNSLNPPTEAINHTLKYKLLPDKEQASLFLTELDPNTEVHVFACFHDSGKHKYPARQLIGTLDKHWHELVSLNQQGYGIFCTVNITDLKGRKKENIVGIRAVWREQDDPNLKALPIEASISVETSPGKGHEYILVQDAPIEEFDLVQQCLVKDWGSDANAKDSSRVLRLPGFFNMKKPSKPHYVRMKSLAHQPPYPWSKVKEIFLPTTEETAPTEINELKIEDIPVCKEEIQEALTFIDPDIDYGNWISIGMAIHHNFRGSAEGLEAWKEWSMTGAKYQVGDCSKRWKNFSVKDGGITVRTLFQMALKEGWKSRTNMATQVTEKDGKLSHPEIASNVIDLIGRGNLITVQNKIYRYTNGIWKPADTNIIKQTVLECAGAVNLTKTSIASILDIVLILTSVENHKWNRDKTSICCKSGILRWYDDPTHKWRWELSGFNREDYCLSQIPQEFTDERPETPLWDSFLNSLFQDDIDADSKKTIIMEMFGYCLLPHANYEKFFILLGEGANGKSVVLTILSKILGAENVSAVQPSELGNKFQRAHLEGKLANIITEIKEGSVVDDASLKSIVSGEITTVERKFGSPFEVEPFATIVAATNHLPHSRDFSKALFRRAIIIPFKRVLAEEEQDRQLINKLTPELPGIFQRALDAIGWVIHRGGIFTSCEDVEDAKRQWITEVDQVSQFVDECCVADPNYQIPVRLLYDSYRQWALETGVKHLISKKSLSIRLGRLGFRGGREGKPGTRVIQGIMTTDLLLEVTS